MIEDYKKFPIFKITKTWYVRAKDVLELKSDVVSNHRNNPDEIKITKVRDDGY